MTTTNRSATFAAFNALKVQPGIERGRANRALGIAQSNVVEAKYATTLDRCNCPDATYRRDHICKHRLALILRTAASEPQVA